VSEALEAYSEAFDSRLDQSYAAPPLPPYLETLMETEAKQDVCFQLIKLFCDRSYPLHKLLNPTSAIPNCLDYRLRFVYLSCWKNVFFLTVDAESIVKKHYRCFLQFMHFILTQT